MTIDQVRELRVGDEVYWNDPDDGLCSRSYVIQSIEIYPQLDTDGPDTAVRITEPDGSELECYVVELT